MNNLYFPKERMLEIAEILEESYKKSLNDKGVDFDTFVKEIEKYWEKILSIE